MIILALDSSGSSCNAGIWQEGQMLAEAHEAMERGQDARLIPMIMSLMAEVGYTFSDIDKIAVIRGPGSFTGVRVGLAAARGMGLAAQKPVIGIDRFAAYRALHASGDLLVVIASKRAELFCQFFPADGIAHAPALMSESQISSFLLTHPDAKVVGDSATHEDNVLMACAILASHADPHKIEYQPQPLYLRAPDVTLVSANSR